jgi:hypothetical protein
MKSSIRGDDPLAKHRRFASLAAAADEVLYVPVVFLADVLHQLSLE